MYEPIYFIDAKAHVVLTINQISTFIKASAECNINQTTIHKRAKRKQMLYKLKYIHQCVNNNI